MGAAISKPADVDEVTGLSVAETEAAADDLYEHRHEAPGDEVPSEPAPEISSVMS